MISEKWDPAKVVFLIPFPGINALCFFFVLSDIRELIQVDDVMEDDSLRFGPNGGLVFCMEYFANNFDWLEESLGHVEDDYILFDCPGKSLSSVSAGSWGFVIVNPASGGVLVPDVICFFFLCRSDWTVHPPACDEAAGGAAPTVGVSGLRSVFGWFPVHGGIF